MYLLQCENVRMYLVDRQRGQLHLPISLQDNQYFPLNVGIAGKCISTGRVQSFTWVSWCS